MLLEEIISYVLIGVIYIISISIHEYAHVAAAYVLGDPTGKMLGRLTPNPLKHIDPIGFVLMFLIGFGWGRPAPYNPNYFKRPYRDELLVALAGPASNIVLGGVGIVVLLVYVKIVGGAVNPDLDMVVSFWQMFSYANFALAAFNMIPLPPLDGYRLIKVMNHRRWDRLEKNMQWIALGFLVLVVFWPFKDVLSSYIHLVATTLYHVFLIPFGLLIG